MLKDNDKNPSAENRASGDPKNQNQKQNQNQNQNKEGTQKSSKKHYSERS